MKFMEKAKRFFTLKRRANDGFTLVELIVVIAILAILAGVAVPAYSGYIKKAEKAGDMQLLAAVNDAFAAACMAEGTQATAVKSAALTWDGNCVVGISGVDGAANAGIDAAFKMFYKGNEGTAFKVLAGKLVFANGVFGEMSEGASKLMDTILNDTTLAGSIQAVKDSIYNEIGYGTLAGQIDNASNLLAGFYGQTNSGFHKLLDGDANTETLIGYLSDDPEEAEAMMDEMLAAKYEEINNDPKYSSLTEEQKEDMAYGQIMANTAILTAAQNSGAIDSDFIGRLENGTAVDFLKTSTDGGEAEPETIAQAAFAYAMYTSYKASLGEDVSSDVNLGDVYNTLATEGFMNYMKNDSAADQAGYHGAMDLIASSAENADSDTASNILLNGFNNAELVALMQGVIK